MPFGDVMMLSGLTVNKTELHAPVGFWPLWPFGLKSQIMSSMMS